MISDRQPPTQVQVVAYLHEWAPDGTRAGDFVHYNDGAGASPVPVAPLPRAGTALDGSKVGRRLPPS